MTTVPSTIPLYMEDTHTICERQRGKELVTDLLEGVGQPEDARSNEGDEDIGEDLDSTVRTIIMHLSLTPVAINADSAAVGSN